MLSGYGGTARLLLEGRGLVSLLLLRSRDAAETREEPLLRLRLSRLLVQRHYAFVLCAATCLILRRGFRLHLIFLITSIVLNI